MTNQEFCIVTRLRFEAFTLEFEHPGMIALAYMLAAQNQKQIRMANKGFFPHLILLETTRPLSRDDSFPFPMIPDEFYSVSEPGVNFMEYSPGNELIDKELIGTTIKPKLRRVNGTAVNQHSVQVLHTGDIHFLPLIQNSIILVNSGISLKKLATLYGHIQEGYSDVTIYPLVPEFNRFKKALFHANKSRYSGITRAWFTVYGAYASIFEALGPLSFDVTDLIKGTRSLYDAQFKMATLGQGGHQ